MLSTETCKATGWAKLRGMRAWGTCGIVVLCGAFFTSCQTGKLSASGYQTADLDGLASVSLPKTLTRLDTLGRKREIAVSTPLKMRLLGDHAPNPEESNFWALSHAFVFGKEAPSAFVLVSRVADPQSFAIAHVYFEWASRLFPFAAPKQLEWKQTKLSKDVSVYEATWNPEPKLEKKAWVWMDRAAQLEVMIHGGRDVVSDEAAKGIFDEVRRSYQLAKPLEDYYARLRKALDALATQRRTNYMALLQKLEYEELDYAPTPKIVYFNQNLACQFWWRPFDNSGVPWEFAIGARLGAVSAASTEEAWAELSGKNPGIDIFGMAPIGNGVWMPYRFQQPKVTMPLRRASELLLDTGWLAEGTPTTAFAGLDFRFDGAVPDLSQWLDQLEAGTKAALDRGLLDGSK